MAPKRAAAARATVGSPLKKKAKTADPTAQKVTKVVRALEASDDATTKLLVAMAPFALSVYALERHPAQQEVVDLIGQTFATMVTSTESEIEQLKARIDGHPADKQAREVAAKEAAIALDEKKAALTVAEAKTSEALIALEDVEGALKKLQSEHKEADNLYAADVQKKSKLEHILNDQVLRKKEEAATKAECNALLKALKPFNIDNSVLMAMQSTLTKAPSERVGFDLVVFDSLEKDLRTRISDVEASLKEKEPAREERAQALVEVEAKVKAAENALEACKSARDEAKAAKKDAEATLKAATKAVSNFIADLLQLGRNLDAKVEDLKVLKEEPLASFEFLKNLKPPEPEPEVPETDKVGSPKTITTTSEMATVNVATESVAAGSTPEKTAPADVAMEGVAA